MDLHDDGKSGNGSSTPAQPRTQRCFMPFGADPHFAQVEPVSADDAVSLFNCISDG